MNKYMDEAIRASKKNSKDNYKTGGPFGAIIVKDNKIISIRSNTVLSSLDPTAHAEINAIRAAGDALGTHDLSGCTLYTSCYPCPMCLSAIVWANIKEVYYANTKEDASAIGFRDDMIYDLLKDLNNSDLIKLTGLNNEDAIKVFQDFSKNSGDLY